MLTDSTKVDLPKICQNPNRVIPIIRPQETVALGTGFHIESIVVYDRHEKRRERDSDRKQ